MEVIRTEPRGYGLLSVSSLLGVLWGALPLLEGSVVYPGRLGFWGGWVVTLGFYCVLLWSLVRLAFGRSFSIAKRYGPLALQLAALALTWAIDFESIAVGWNFRSRMVARTEVVEMVRRGDLALTRRSGEIQPTAELPAKFRSLSSGGRISATHHENGFSVTFYVKRASMFPDDDYTAFVCRSGTGEPSTEVEDTDRFIKVTPLSSHWYFVVHT